MYHFNNKHMQKYLKRKGLFYWFPVLLLVIYSSFGFRTDHKEEIPKTLRVISYNIWNGFDWSKDIDRKNKFITWVNMQQPDVLALQELCGYTKEKLKEDAQKWGHNYVEILKTSGYPVGITSNSPIEIKEKILEDMHHGALHCKIASIDFMVVHFSPFSYVKRQEEAKIILNKLVEISKSQDEYIVLGDFNSLSPFDADLYKNVPTLLPEMIASELKHTHVRNLMNGELEYGVIGQFLGHPLIDIVQKYTLGWNARVSCPTQVFETKKGGGRAINSTRIDYILASPLLAKRCIDAKVINKKETFYLSDHYPIFSVFKIK